MITSVLKKSTPLNLVLGVILMLVFFLLYEFQDLTWTSSAILIVQKVGLIVLLLGSIFITNFITKKNGLSKDSSYTPFFYFMFLLFFPSIMSNMNLILSNFFILLALRRLISLQSLKSSKEKVFDASLWIFVAALFQFWSILYLVLVFTSIIFHVAKDYKNWILPFIAFFTVGIISIGISLIFNLDFLDYINENAKFNFNINYFTNVYQNIAFSIYATVTLFFMVSMLVLFPNKSILMKSTLKKIIISFFIGILIFAISSNKSNDLLLFSMPPLSIMATSHIEVKQLQLKQEMVLVVLILSSLFAFFFQL